MAISSEQKQLAINRVKNTFAIFRMQCERLGDSYAFDRLINDLNNFSIIFNSDAYYLVTKEPDGASVTFEDDDLSYEDGMDMLTLIVTEFIRGQIYDGRDAEAIKNKANEVIDDIKDGVMKDIQPYIDSFLS